MISSSYPLGEPLPPTDPHAISVSMPEWNNVVRIGAFDQSVIAKLKCNYPRFYQHAVLRSLNEAVLERVCASDTTRCRIFPSEDGMKRCAEYIRQRIHDDSPIQELSFSLPQKHASDQNMIWARFSAVLFREQHREHADEEWDYIGEGMSSRHAEFCLERFPFMESTSSDASLQTRATSLKQKIPLQSWGESDISIKNALKATIAKYATSQKPGQGMINPYDVFLYPRGMSAIGAVARLLAPSFSSVSEAVVFGWPYTSTPKCVKDSGYERLTFYCQGIAEELDQLEELLSSGRRITCLFCETPSNPLCSTPDLHRLRRLADQYEFIVICDETIGTFINLDVLPYCDILITSLTKQFSGACNVMGGSVVLNAKSRFYDTLQIKFNNSHEDVLFPLDAKVLLTNCLDFPSRVRKASRNGLAVANFFSRQSCIANTYYPTMVTSAPLYERYRRPSGGYGCLLSLVFKRAESAVKFYNSVDCCKGPTFGTNFTLVLPYSQLAHAGELDWAESAGHLAKHIVRISAGIEDKEILIEKFSRALQEVDALEMEYAV